MDFCRGFASFRGVYHAKSGDPLRLASITSLTIYTKILTLPDI